MLKEKNNTKLVVIALGIFIGGLLIGMLIGWGVFSEKSPVSTSSQYKDLVDMAFPKPPEDIRTMTGEITKITDTALEVKVGDPEDYLPHKDGSAQATILRTAKINDQTVLSIYYPTQIDKNGNIKKDTIKISDLKIGETVTVTAGENIRTAKEFTTLLVEKIQY